MEEIPCALCGSEQSKSFNEATYHLNLLPPLEVKRCVGCGFIFMNPRPDQAERNDLFSGTVPENLRPYSNVEANYGAVTRGRLDFFRLRIKELIPKLSGDPSSLKFLDVGASSGYMVEAALEAGLIAEGVEPGRSGIASAKARGISIIQGTAENLPFENDYFDLVHSHHVFEHVANPHLSAKEVYRVLKPGGTILIEVPNQFDNIRFYRDVKFGRVHQRNRDIRSIHHLSFFSKKSLRYLLTGVGFKSVKVSTHYTLHPTGLRKIPGYLTMLAGNFFLGGERLIGLAKK